MEPTLVDTPAEIPTSRLTLRVPRVGDGVALAEGIRASLPELRLWLPWANEAYCDTDGESWVRRAIGDLYHRRQLPYFLVEGGAIVGNVSAYQVDWKVRTCEVGYWLRTDRVGRGYMTEALSALTTNLTTTVGMRRVAVRCDVRNTRSAAVARRAGFQLEGTLRCDSLGVDDLPQDTHIFSRLADVRSSPD